MKNPEQKTYEGTIKTIGETRKNGVTTGWITPENEGKDIFFRVPLNKDGKEEVELTVGTRVQFKGVMSPKGPWANIVNIDGQEAEMFEVSDNGNPTWKNDESIKRDAHQEANEEE